jgi:hypothetical protein
MLPPSDIVVGKDHDMTIPQIFHGAYGQTIPYAAERESTKANSAKCVTVFLSLRPV